MVRDLLVDLVSEVHLPGPASATGVEVAMAARRETGEKMKAGLNIAATPLVMGG